MVELMPFTLVVGDRRSRVAFLTSLISEGGARGTEVIFWSDLEVDPLGGHLDPHEITRTLEKLIELVREGIDVVVPTGSLEVINKALAMVEAEGLRHRFGLLIVQLRDGELLSKLLSWEEATKLIEDGLDIRLAGSLL